MKQGWQVKRLGEVCELVRGPFGGSLKKSSFVTKGLAVYEQQHAIHNRFSTFRYFIDTDKYAEMKRFEVQPGNILMSCSGTIGRVAKVPQDAPQGIINQALLNIKPSATVHNDYLLYALKSPYFFDQISNSIEGVAIKNVASVKVLKGIKIPLPPLEEQKRIVAVLDEAFAGLETARNNAEANLKNAEELFEGAIDKALDTQANGMIKPIGSFAEVNYGFTASANDQEVGPKFLRITDIKEDGVNWCDVPYCSISEVDFSKHELKDGDIVFARTGATTGKSFHITDPPKAVSASYLIRVRIQDEQIAAAYLFMYFQSSQYWREINQGISGSAQGGFNASKLKDLCLPIPSLEMQHTLVQDLDAVTNHVRRLKSHYLKVSEDLSNLRQSLLQKAFAGELT